MAEREGNTKTPRRRARPLRYFYLNDNLHKSLHINRGADTITAWCYPLHKRVAYTYSDVKKFKKPAFTTQEVAKMLMRSRLTLEHAILRGDITPPQYTYGLNENKNKFKYMWSEDNVLEAHAYLSTVHRGRPRNDGLITPQRLPTVRELRAMMRNETVLYVQDRDGEFKPVWQAEDFD